MKVYTLTSRLTLQANRSFVPAWSPNRTQKLAKQLIPAHTLCSSSLHLQSSSSPTAGRSETIPLASPSTSDPLKRWSRLRDRAGIPKVHRSGQNSIGLEDDSEQDASNAFRLIAAHRGNSAYQLQPRSRTQAERNRMSYGEKMLALDLLEDLNIPIEKLSDHITSFDHQSETLNSSQAHSSRNILGLDTQSVSELQSLKKQKTLLRQRPAKISEDEARFEDIIKEMVDDQIRLIQQISSDFQLLDWIDTKVLVHHHVESNEGRTPFCTLKSPDVSEPTPLEANQWEEQANIADPREFLNRPLCLSPLLSPLLAHLLETFSVRFRNPHLSIRLFEEIRSHPNSLVRYLGLTPQVYFKIIKIRWDRFKDLNGIKNDLIEMKLIGIQPSEKILKLIQSIIQTIAKSQIEFETFIEHSKKNKQIENDPHHHHHHDHHQNHIHDSQLNHHHDPFDLSDDFNSIDHQLVPSNKNSLTPFFLTQSDIKTLNFLESLIDEFIEFQKTIQFFN